MYGQPPYNENNRYQPQSNRPINPMVPHQLYYNQTQAPMYYYAPPTAGYNPYGQPLQFMYPSIPAGMQLVHAHQMPHPPAGAPIPGSTNHQMVPHSTQHLSMSNSDASNPSIMSYQGHSDTPTQSTNVSQSHNHPQQPRAKRTLQIIDPNTNKEISLDKEDKVSRNSISESSVQAVNNSTVSADNQSTDSSFSSDQSSKKHHKESMLREVQKRALEKDDSRSFANTSIIQPVDSITPPKVNATEATAEPDNNNVHCESQSSKTTPICIETSSPPLSDDQNANQPEPSNSSVNSLEAQTANMEEGEYEFHRERHESDASATKRKLMYDRLFLLSRSKVKLSLQRPELSATCSEILQDEPHEGPVYSSSADVVDFTPPFASYSKGHNYQGKNHKNSPNNMRRNRPSMPATPQKVIETFRRKEEMKRGKHAYVPKVLNNESKQLVNGDVEEVHKELERSIRAILNRVTPQNLDDCMAKLMLLDFGSEEGLSILTNTIFVKAVKEEAYSVTFADICKRLIMIKAPGEQNKPSVNFKSLLLTQCQKKFETPLKDQLEKVSEEWDLKVEAQESEATKKIMFDDKDEQIAKAKDMYYGNIRFIGELFLKDILPARVILSCIDQLIKSAEQEAIESLCKLLETVGFKLDSKQQESSRKLFDKSFDEIKVLRDDLNNRLKYKLMDIIEMRNRGWVLRKVQEQQKIRPMTKEELELEDRKKAHDREQEMNEQRAAAKKSGPSDSRRNTAGRASQPPPPQRQPINVSKMAFSSQMSADDILTFRPGKPFSNLAKGCGSKQDKKKQQSSTDNEWIPAKGGRSSHGNRQFSRDNSRSRDPSPRNSGPASLPPPQLSGPNVVRSVSFPSGSSHLVTKSPTSSNASRGSPMPSPSVSTAALPTVEEKDRNMKKLKDSLPEDSDEFNKVYTKSEHILLEFIASDSFDEDVFKRIQNYEPFFVSNLLNIMIEKDRNTREKTGLLFSRFVSTDDIIQGFDLFLENAEDLLIDIPSLWRFLAECLQILLRDENTNIGYFTEILSSMSDPAKILSNILHMASGRLGHQMVGQIFEQSQLNWKMFLSDEEDLEKFIEKEKLQFTITNNSSCAARDLSEIENSLMELQLTDKLRNHNVENEEIFNILENEVDPTTAKTIPYIQMVLSLVFEATIDSKGKLEPTLLEERLPIIKFIVHQRPEEKVQVIYAMQRFNLKLESQNRSHFLESGLDALTTNFILDSDTITKWEEDEPSVTEGYLEAKETLRTYLPMIRTSL